LRLRAAVESDITGARRPARADVERYVCAIVKGPPVAVREAQWREVFAKRDGNWFCVVAERPNGELVAFAKDAFSDNRSDPGALGAGV
jgi:hypothetical protein